jgi:hypothetical protein
MAQQEINIGAAPNDGLGTPIRTAFDYCNNNFTELYNRVQTVAPTSSEGSPGDLAGMISWDSTYFYVCVADYEGSTTVWQRIAFDTVPW